MGDSTRIVTALERIAAALEALAAERDVRPQKPAQLPPRRGRQRRQAPARPSDAEVDDVAAEKARRALERMGLR